MAITFDGASQSVSLGSDINLLRNVSGMSLMCWANPRIDQIDNSFISVGIGPPPGATNTNRAALRYGGTTNTILAIVRNADGNAASNITSAAAMVSNEWQHIGFSYDCVSKAVEIYRNGVGIFSGTATNATGSATANTNSKMSAIAARPDGTLVLFDGQMEDTRIYTRVLSPDEFLTIYSLQGKDNIVDGLQGRWLLQEAGEGETVVSVPNLADNNVVGTPVGTPVYSAGPTTPRRRTQYFSPQQ